LLNKKIYVFKFFSCIQTNKYSPSNCNTLTGFQNVAKTCSFCSDGERSLIPKIYSWIIRTSTICKYIEKNVLSFTAKIVASRPRSCQFHLDFRFFCVICQNEPSKIISRNTEYETKNI